MRPILPRLIPPLWLLLAGSASVAGGSLQPKPDPALNPAAVVQLQLAALARVDQPQRDAGMAVVFGFASPGNRSLTGPLKRFAAMIREGYPALLNHRSSTLAPLIMQGDVALQGVELIDREGRRHRYVFQLSKQPDGEFKDCWMTDSVLQAPDDPEVST